MARAIKLIASRGGRSHRSRQSSCCSLLCTTALLLVLVRFSTSGCGTLASAAAAPRPVAIVTGGTRGIGSGIAAALAESGYDLLLTYNTDAEAARAYARHLREGTAAADCLTVECVGGDISLESTRDEVFECLDTKFPGQRLKAMVHNAGQYVGITSENADDLESGSLAFGDGSLLDQDTGRTNLDTMHYYQRMYGEAWVDLCERSLQRMAAGGDDNGAAGGHLIGISSPSVCAHYYGPDPSYSMPGSGKCLMEYSMRIYAKQAGARHINCNIVVPGVTRTEGWNRLAKTRGLPDEKEMLKGIVERICPMQVTMSPREVGNTVAFLCSDAGKFITGTTLPVDGGMHLTF